MWSRIVMLLLLGYFCLGRSFAYWGIPPWYMFLGEIVLFCFIFWGPPSTQGRWPWPALKSSHLVRYRLFFFIFVGFGLLQVAHGLLSGPPPLSTVRDMAFNYYPLYFLLGLWVGLGDQQFLKRLVRFAAWANGLYGLMYILILNRSDWVLPGVSRDVLPVPIFGMPEFSAVILLGLLSFEKDLRQVWVLLLLNGAVLIGMFIRAGWLAFF